MATFRCVWKVNLSIRLRISYKATVPKVADKPKVMLNMILSGLLGTMLGLGGALFAEIMDSECARHLILLSTLDCLFWVLLLHSHALKSSLVYSEQAREIIKYGRLAG